MLVTLPNIKSLKFWIKNSCQQELEVFVLQSVSMTEWCYKLPLLLLMFWDFQKICGMVAVLLILFIQKTEKHLQTKSPQLLCYRLVIGQEANQS